MRNKYIKQKLRLDIKCAVPEFIGLAKTKDHVGVQVHDITRCMVHELKCALIVRLLKCMFIGKAGCCNNDGKNDNASV